jgi:hypothetical protein
MLFNVVSEFQKDNIIIHIDGKAHAHHHRHHFHHSRHTLPFSQLYHHRRYHVAITTTTSP